MLKPGMRQLRPRLFCFGEFQCFSPHRRVISKQRETVSVKNFRQAVMVEIFFVDEELIQRY